MTRQLIAIKWLLYTLAALLFVILQDVVLSRITVWGVHPFLLPCLAVAAATLEPQKESLIFAAAFGLVCDLMIPTPFEGFYLLTLLLCALLAGLAARHVIMAGLPCTLIVLTMTLVIHALFQAIILGYTLGVSLGACMSLLLRECVVTLPFMLPIHFLYTHVHKRIADAA